MCGLDRNRRKYYVYHPNMGYYIRDKRFIQDKHVCITPNDEQDPGFPCPPGKRMQTIPRVFDDVDAEDEGDKSTNTSKGRRLLF